MNTFKKWAKAVLVFIGTQLGTAAAIGVILAITLLVQGNSEEQFFRKIIMFANNYSFPLDLVCNMVALVITLKFWTKQVQKLQKPADPVGRF
mgnify:CR=1 FL=1